jgi:hypothetical protein
MSASRALVLLAIFVFLSGDRLASAQTGPLAVLGYPVAANVRGARGLPDRRAAYKAVFDITHTADQPVDLE